jgi:hypothetical protein
MKHLEIRHVSSGFLDYYISQWLPLIHFFSEMGSEAPASASSDAHNCFMG